VLFSAAIPYIYILAPKIILTAILENVGFSEWVLLLIVMFFTIVILTVLSAFFTEKFKTHITITRNGCFGKMLSEKMMKMKYDLLENTDIQNLCYRANTLFWSENSGIAGVFDNLKKLVAGVLTLLGLIIILVKLHPLIPIILGISASINIVFIIKRKKNENLNRPIKAELERRMRYVNLTMRDVDINKDIRIFNMTKWLSDWFNGISIKAINNTKNVQRKLFKFDFFIIITDIIREICVLGYIIYAAYMKQFLIDDFILYVTSSVVFSTTLVSLLEYLFSIRQFAEQTNDFINVMNLEEDKSTRSKIFEKWSHIYMKNISYKYHDNEEFALKNINIEIQRGEKISVVGVNGAGKTTLLKVLIGLYTQNGGEIVIQDINGEQFQNINRYELFSVVFQQIFQYAFSLEENVALEDKNEIIPSKLEVALNLSGLIEVVNNLPKGANTLLRKEFDPEGITLSYGQAQLLALARVIYRDTSIVVLDEPISALDPIIERDFYHKFKLLFKNKTCIFVSHRLSSVLFSDKIILLDNGTISDIGKHDELLKRNEIYKNMWETQSKRYK